MGVVIPQVITEDKAGGAQIIEGSLRFDSSKSHYLTRTPSSAGNRRTWTWSGWVKRVALGAVQYLWEGGSPDGTTTRLALRFNSSDQLNVLNLGILRTTTQVFRDLSAWYHIVVAVDTSQATADNRLKIYVNGRQVTDFASSSDLSQNTDTGWNMAAAHSIGRTHIDGGNLLSSYVSDFYNIDGQVLDPSYFGYTDQLTNTWRPKKINLSSITTGKVYIDNTYTGGSVGPGIYNAALTGNITDGSYSGDTFTASNAAWVITFDLYNYDSFTLSSLSVGAQSNQTWYYSNDSSFASGVVGPNSGTIANGTWSTTISGTKYRYLRIQNVPSATFTVVGNITNAQNAWGINGFYLPFDGNSPIGQDQSGNGRNWTPVNFGGSNTLEKATGALPILNTDGGGKVARVGVRTDSNASSLVLALPLVGIKSDFSNAVNSGTSNKTVNNISNNTTFSSSFSNFYGGSASFNGSNTVLNAGSSTDFQLATNFTVEFWVYLNSTSNSTLVSYYYYTDGDQERGWIIGLSSNKIRFRNSFGSVEIITSNTVSTSRWYHIAAVINGGTSQIYINGVADGASGNIGTPDYSNANLTIGASIYANQPSGYSSYLNGYIQDLRIYKGVAKYTQNFIPASTDPDILPDTPSGVAYSSNVALVPSTDGAVAFQGTSAAAAATNYLNAGTSSDFTVGTNGNFTFEAFINPTSVSDTSVFGIGSSNIFAYRIISGSPYLYIQSTGGILNTGTIAANKWTHIAVTRNGGTLYSFIDGVLVGSVANTGSFDASTGTGAGTFIGAANLTATSPPNYSFTGQISNLHWVNGTALYTSNFTPPTAPITSVANTKLLCCKSQTSATVADVTPGSITANGNAAATNFNPFTANINAVRGQESGYATLNPLFIWNGTHNLSFLLSDGNLQFTQSSSTNAASSSSIVFDSGKWYWEVVHTAFANSSYDTATYIATDSRKKEYDPRQRGVAYLPSGNKKVNDSNTSYGSSYAVGDVIGIAFDADSQTVTYYKNGISQGSISGITNLSGYSATVLQVNGTDILKGSFNFGQKPFKFPPPAGFQPLALANTPRPTIVRPDQYVGIVTYTGNGSTQSINVGWKPDFVWVKGRNQAYGHRLLDTVRGATNALASSSTAAEFVESSGVTSFNNTGFNLGSNVSYNENTTTYVAWAWKAGGNSNTYNINDIGYSTASAAGLTAGTITPTGASVNTKSGFSIVSFTSDSSTNIFSVAHGLQNTPKFVIVKSRDNGVAPWYVYHSSLATDNYLRLNGTNATASDGSNQWGNGMTSSVIGLRAGYTTVASTATIAYCWAEIPGFSKFGSYTGNGSTDGPMVVTGFRPRWILVKRSDSTGNWYTFDTFRDSYNVSNKYLLPNSSGAEGTFTFADITSNGFKLRDNSVDWNASGGTILYAAFAEAPSFNLYGGQANAR